MASDQLRGARRAIDALSSAGIRWATLRDDPLAPQGGDIDLLVHPKDAGCLDTVLAAEGFARLRTWRHGDHRFHVAYDQARDEWTKVDAVTRFAYRSGHELPAATVDAVWSRVVRDDAVNRLHPDDEFWALLLHCLFDRGDVPARHLARLRHLAETDPDGPLLDALRPSAVSVSAVHHARDGNAAGLVALAGPLQRGLRRPPLGRRAWHLGVRGASPFIRAVRRPGVSVVLLGPDGAGKSTLIGSLKGTLPVPVRTHYLGLYGDQARRARALGLAGQLAMAWGTYLTAAVERRRGRIVIFDRYGYDALLRSPDGRDTRRRRLRGVLLGRLAPRPDLVLVLDAPAVSLLARKAEHDLETIELKRADYRHLAQHLARGVTTELVDASADIGTVRRRVTGLIWGTFARLRAGVDSGSSRARYSGEPAPTEEVSAHGNR